MSEIPARTILITGAKGYVGSYVTKFYQQFFNVVEMDLDNGDITDVEQTTAFFLEHRPSLVIHLAAKSTVDCGDCFGINVLGTKNILTAMIKSSCKNIIFFSSCAVYGNNELAKEHHLCRPLSDYGYSKLWAEYVISSICRQNGLNWCVFRPFNIFGQSPNNVGNRLFSKLESGSVVIRRITSHFYSHRLKSFKPFSLYSYPIRDYIHLKDLNDVMFQAVNRMLKGYSLNTIFNLCSGEGISNYTIANKWKDYLDGRLSISFGRLPVTEAEVIIGSNEKTSTYFQWHPKLTVEHCIITSTC